MLKTLKKIDDVIDQIEFGYICIFLSVVLSFSFAGVILRNLFSTGVMWMDVLGKNLVLWITLLGAALAVKNKRTLNIEVLNRLVPESKKKYLKLVLTFVSMAVCTAVGTAAGLFLQSEGDARDMVLGNLPVIFIEIIIPIGYALISFHFLVQIVEQIEELVETVELRVFLQVHFLIFFLVSTFWNIGIQMGWNIFLCEYYGLKPLLLPIAPLLFPALSTALLAVIGILAFLGLPLFVVFAGIAMLCYIKSDLTIAILPGEIMRITSLPPLIMIPLFTFAGCLMAQSQTPLRLVSLSRALLGWVPGGLAIVCLFACAFFTAFTGASGVTIIAVGGLLLPALLKERYSEKFTLGLLTTSGSLGLLFPPSLAIILYGTLAKVKIDHLFIAGVIPGVFLMVILALYIFYISGKFKLDRQPFSWREVRKALRGAFWELPLPFIVLFGVYGGIISLTEVAATVAFYVLIVEVVIYKDVHWRKDIPRIMRESMVLIGGVLIILASALGLTNFLIDQEVPNKIFSFLSQYIHGKTSFLIVLNVFFLVVGAMLDIFSAVIVVPLICPIALKYGIDPVHLGIIFLVNLEIAYSFPPAGLNLFIASFRFNQPITKLYVASLPFIALYIVALILITYIPDISLVTLRMLNMYTPAGGAG